MYDSLIVVMPTLDMVVARAGKSWARQKDADPYDVLKPFLQPIAAAAASPVIGGIKWAPTNSILRLAKGSDNWPLTWADDDVLYTAYGDGNGFEPFVKPKLSLGIAKVLGGPLPFRARTFAPTRRRHWATTNEAAKRAACFLSMACFTCSCAMSAIRNSAGPVTTAGYGHGLNENLLRALAARHF